MGRFGRLRGEVANFAYRGGSWSGSGVIFALMLDRRFFVCIEAGGVRGAAVRLYRGNYLVIGFTRIARGEPWAGSVTGGEACGYRCSEKEGFTHPWLWRAPCFWGTHEWELHAVDT
jgi:hypothetical protein